MISNKKTIKANVKTNEMSAGSEQSSKKYTLDLN